MLVPLFVSSYFRLNGSQLVEDFNVTFIDSNALRPSLRSIESSSHLNNLASLAELAL